MTTTRLFDVRNIDHLVLRTGNAPRLIAFYRDVLGLPIERQTDKGLTQLRAGASLIHPHGASALRAVRQ